MTDAEKDVCLGCDNYLPISDFDRHLCDKCDWRDRDIMCGDDWENAHFLTRLNQAERPLSFSNEWATAILLGQKTRTARIKDKGFCNKELVYIQTSKDMEKTQSPAILRVSNRDATNVHAMTDFTARKHGVETSKAFLAEMRRIYENHTITPSKMFYIIQFELMEINLNWESPNDD